MEISKGMYVRTNQGIAKIVEKPNISVVVWNYRKVIYVDKNGHPVPTSFNFFVFEDEITVFSFNIIDLIEVGDYVNGVEVEEINDKEIMLVDTHLWIDKEVANRLIESIVTKEQFDSMKYVVERDK